MISAMMAMLVCGAGLSASLHVPSRQRIRFFTAHQQKNAEHSPVRDCGVARRPPPSWTHRGKRTNLGPALVHLRDGRDFCALVTEFGVNIVAVASSLAVYVVIGLVVYALCGGADGPTRRRSPADGRCDRYALASAVLEGRAPRHVDLAAHPFNTAEPARLSPGAGRLPPFRARGPYLHWLVLGAMLVCAPMLLAFLNPFLAYSLFGYESVAVSRWACWRWC